MEERVFIKDFKTILEEFPEMGGGKTITSIVKEILPLYGFEFSNKVIAVKNPNMAVYQGKVKYLQGKFKDKEGIFLVFVGIGFESGNLQVIYDPQVSLF